jgi:glycosyltransferase involved in cell wall biosynthesis
MPVENPNPPPLISVVIPAYNAANTIAATLGSVRGQTYTSIEILVVDDGSTDATRLIVEKITAEEPRLRIIGQQNAGVARARNRALAEAQGDWIATIDADDIWHPEKLERQMKVALTSPLAPALIYSWCRSIDAEDRVIADQGRPMHQGQAFEQLLVFNFINNASNVLVRTDAVRAVGGFEEAFQAFRAFGAEDIALYLAIAERWPIAPAPGFLVGYRTLENSMSAAPKRMRMSVELVLFHLEQKRPDIPVSLMALSRTFYDIYAASLALRSGMYGLFIRFLTRAMMRRPGITSFFLVCAMFWRHSGKRAVQRGRSLFSSLQIFEPSYKQPFAEAFDRYRTSRVASTSVSQQMPRR